MDAYLSHLGLTAWPFSIVPRQEFCNFLAGRPLLRDDIDALLVGLSRRDTSSIHILWSWFGAGKTHSLYYLADKARQVNEHSNVELYTSYSEFPKSARTFVDLYRSVMLKFDRQMLVDCFLEAATSPAGSPQFRALIESNPDLATAFRAMTMGVAHDQSTAVRWLRGDALAIGEFRRLGISERINTSDQAVRVLASLIEICDIAARSRSRRGFRLIWILDEFQRIARSGRTAIRDINAGLHSLFNLTPVGLSLIISFSGLPNPRNLPDWLTPELRDRIGATKVMILPPFQPTEALGFIKEILERFRIPKSHSNDIYFPFTREACEFITTEVSKQTELRPRVIMHALNAVLAEADPLIEKGALPKVDVGFARSVLKDYVIVSDDNADGD